MAVRVSQRYSPEEYLARERKAEYKSEYIDGFIVAMAGASEAHSLIVVNVAGELRARLKSQPCRTYATDMRVKVSNAGLYTYPDVSVVCGERRFEDVEVDTLLNPNVLVEVLSESTEAYDRGKKFARYQWLESLTDYVLIAQDEARVEHFVRQGEHWLLTVITGLEGTLRLESVGCELPLREIYDRVEFPQEDGAPERGPAAG
jgi:Uma2 family endonuclease